MVMRSYIDKVKLAIPVRPIRRIGLHTLEWGRLVEVDESRRPKDGIDADGKEERCGVKNVECYFALCYDAVWARWELDAAVDGSDLRISEKRIRTRGM